MCRAAQDRVIVPQVVPHPPLEICVQRRVGEVYVRVPLRLEAVRDAVGVQHEEIDPFGKAICPLTPSKPPVLQRTVGNWILGVGFTRKPEMGYNGYRDLFGCSVRIR
eukprot:gene4111-biopygen12906